MTDPSSLITTNPLVNPFPVTAIPTQQSPLLNGVISDVNLAEEEYTIKCICGYADDDGNTVYCEKCDTWQHIECYYPSKKVPEEHFCADCFPRDVDAKRAAERQRRHREALDGGDRKVKRPTSKPSKKKLKDSISIEQVNGWHLDRHDSSSNGRDQPPPAKKPKTSHRTSGSIASLNGNGETRKRASSNLHSYPSPSKSPQDAARYPPIPLYTTEFLELYDRDEGTTDAQGNEHTITALNQLSVWRTDESLVASPGEQPSNHAPFVRATGPLDPSAYPPVTVESVERKDVEIDGKIPRWKYITMQAPVAKDEVVGEIRGSVGMLPEYCSQSSSTNRWAELGHPDPFVFFHPHMNVYIDSRRNGTQFRYLRRSCVPNVTLKTFITDDGDWRHCFVAKDDLPAGRELTAAWFLDPNIMLSGDPTTDQDEQPFSRQCDWVSRVLANFGDCACNKGSACGFARFDRRIKPSEGIEKAKAGRKKKPKVKPAVSPKSTGQATNSRAGSEALKQEDDEHDSQSTSGSASDPKSRDMTPTAVAALDADPVLGAQLTDREIRKLKALEQREQERNRTKEKKTKKRTSGGSNLNTPTANGPKHFLNPGAIGAESYSGSPPPRFSAAHARARSKVVKQTPPRPVYADSGTQTSPDDIEVELPPAKRMKYITPQQRLLRKVLANRSRYEQRCQVAGVSPRSFSVSPMTSPGREVDMKDAGGALFPESTRSAALLSPSSSSEHNASPTVSPTYPLPSQAAHSYKQFKVPAPKLQLSSMPPVPMFSSGAGTPTTAVGTPGTVHSPVAMSSVPARLSPPVVTPSPAKKKLSLGDYMKSRRNTSSSVPVTEHPPAENERKASSESPVPTSGGMNGAPLRESIKTEAAVQGVQENAVEDTLMKDADDEPEYVPPESVGDIHPAPLSATAIKADLMVSASDQPASTVEASSDVTNVMAQLAKLKENATGGLV